MIRSVMLNHVSIISPYKTKQKKWKTDTSSRSGAVYRKLAMSAKMHCIHRAVRPKLAKFRPLGPNFMFRAIFRLLIFIG